MTFELVKEKINKENLAVKQSIGLMQQLKSCLCCPRVSENDA
jgi:hypothetical protein